MLIAHFSIRTRPAFRGVPPPFHFSRCVVKVIQGCPISLVTTGPLHQLYPYPNPTRLGPQVAPVSPVETCTPCGALLWGGVGREGKGVVGSLHRVSVISSPPSFRTGRCHLLPFISNTFFERLLCVSSQSVPLHSWLLPKLRKKSGRSRSADLQSGALGPRAEGRPQLGEATGEGRGWVAGPQRGPCARRPAGQRGSRRRRTSFLAQGRPLVAVAGRAGREGIRAGGDRPSRTPRWGWPGGRHLPAGGFGG